MKQRTYWNGEPAKVRKVFVKVGPAAKSTYWYAGLEGTIRKAIEVEQAGCRFLLDDEDGSGWQKVTVGKGGPSFPHSSLSGEIVDDRKDGEKIL